MRTELSTHDRQLIDDYLTEIGRLSADLPAQDQRELLENLETHIEARLLDGLMPVPAVLEELGSPQEVAESAGIVEEPLSARPTSQRAVSYDAAALLLVTVGFFVVPVAGWILGVALIWAGPRWSRADRVLAVALWPVAIGVPMLLATTVPGQPGKVVGLVAVVVALTCWLPWVTVRLIRSSALARS